MTISSEFVTSIECNGCKEEAKITLYDVFIHGTFMGINDIDMEDEVTNMGWIWLSIDEQYCSESCNRGAHEPEPEETLSAAERNPSLR